MRPSERSIPTILRSSPSTPSIRGDGPIQSVLEHFPVCRPQCPGNYPIHRVLERFSVYRSHHPGDGPIHCMDTSELPTTKNNRRLQDWRKISPRGKERRGNGENR